MSGQTKAGCSRIFRLFLRVVMMEVIPLMKAARLVVSFHSKLFGGEDVDTGGRIRQMGRRLLVFGRALA